ncbi:GAF domain-containing protein [Limnoglobus roseus]|uniref:GAF domain-containing protein n=1 Tax=Limnoglobus roseus TaxID=2598579 RepID=A0A5C1ANF3_9BACT|nr:GAF domain-containing protein [Limnoglobus roseus]QEL19262.1 hypothetical protein PX52LOC_06324 [Limnoglobus roseus]
MHTPPDAARDQLEAVLDRDGVRPALAFLNGTSGHRFSALFSFAADHTRNLYFYDRQNPDVAEGADHPIELTYCVYVREEGGPFLLADATVDERVMLHAAQFRVQSYCGVPLLSPTGQVVGTLCHYDVEPVEVRPEALALMLHFADLLARRGGCW